MPNELIIVPDLVFFTDSAEAYSASKATGKVLFCGSQLEQADFLSDEALRGMNLRLSGAEIEAGERFVEELSSIVDKLAKHSPSTFQKEVVYSLLFGPMMRQGLPRFQLEMLLGEFKRLIPADTTFQFDLGGHYSWFAQSHPEYACTIRTENHSRSLFRNLLSGINVKQVPKRKGSGKRLLILTYNIDHHLELFRPFVQQVLSTTGDIHFDIVTLSFFENENFSPQNLLGDTESRVEFYQLSDFRAIAKDKDKHLLQETTGALSELSFLSNDPYFKDKAVQHAWLEKCLKSLLPDATIICNVHEIGRSLSEISRGLGIPSVQVDYGLFSDHHVMSSSMQFTLRACLGQSTKDVWEKRGDRSDNIVPIGFLKLDEADKNLHPEEKDTLWPALGLSAQKPTVFFASTWTPEGEIYHTEKLEIIRYLSDYCQRRDFNLLIKLHPLEKSEDTIGLLVTSVNQRICSHNELSLNKAICFSDFIVTQGSSIVVEALLFDKWPVFMGISPDKKLILAGMTTSDDIDYFTPGKAFESFMGEWTESAELQKKMREKIQRFQQDIIHTTEQNASSNLFREICKLIGYGAA